MAAYYNEIDPFAAQWLRNLIAAGHIAAGDVDERSISDVKPDDLRGYTQCHFFAGIGGWSYALRLAGWPDDQPVWTGSCPCQPFSTAGKGDGFADERHLWPDFHCLIANRRPAIVLGEQVASSEAMQWIDLVFSDMEGEGYTCRAQDRCAAGVGAPHIRQRLFWVADAARQQRQECLSRPGQSDCTARSGATVEPARLCGDDWLANTGRPRPTNGFWRDADWLFCRDGKWRAVEPGTFPLAHGIPARVGRLRGYGNAIVPQLAAEFIKDMERIR